MTSNCSSIGQLPQIEQLQSLLHADDRLVTNLLHFDLPRLILTRLDYLHAQTQQEVSLKEQKKEGNNTKYGQDVCSSGHLECRRELRPFGMAGISLAAWKVELGILLWGWDGLNWICGAMNRLLGSSYSFSSIGTVIHVKWSQRLSGSYADVQREADAE